MDATHPVDRAGRPLPDSGWPEDRRAPADLELVRRFCNTTNLESGADLLADAADLDGWLRAQGEPAIGATIGELADLVHLREAIRAVASAHRTGDDGGALADLAACFRAVDVGISDDDRIALVPTAAPGTVGHLRAQLALAVVAARAAGSWPRLKSCQRCGWVFHDHSRNGSGRWCSMQVCGGREKVRRHRARARPA